MVHRLDELRDQCEFPVGVNSSATSSRSSFSNSATTPHFALSNLPELPACAPEIKTPAKVHLLKEETRCRFWTKDDWDAYKNIIKKRSPGLWTFLEDHNGEKIEKEYKTKIASICNEILGEIMRRYPEISKWRELQYSARQHSIASLEEKVQIFRLCENHYKANLYLARRFSSLIYEQKKRRNGVGKTQGEIEEEEEEEEEEDDIEEEMEVRASSCGPSMKRSRLENDDHQAAQSKKAEATKRPRVEEVTRGSPVHIRNTVYSETT
jgi:hypothetical protein